MICEHYPDRVELREPMIWLPYPNFLESLQSLDDYILGRQLHESGIVLDYLVGFAREQLWTRNRWSRMWRGCESALGLYHSLAKYAWVKRGYFSQRAVPYDYLHEYTTKTLHYARDEFVPVNEIVYPQWLGNEQLHSSHRSMLLSLNPDHYSQFGWIGGAYSTLYWPEGYEAPGDKAVVREIPELKQINSER